MCFNILHGNDLAGIDAQNKYTSVVRGGMGACTSRIALKRPGLLRTCAVLMGVFDHLNFGCGDQPLSDYFIEEWQQFLNFVL